MKKKQNLWRASYARLGKMIRIMRLTIFVVFISLYQAIAVRSYSQQTKLTLVLNNVSVEKVIDEIEQATDFFFLYNKDRIDVERKVDLNVKGESIDKVLDRLFQNSGVTYTIKNRQILLIGSRFPWAESGMSAQRQQSVTGKVTDLSGSPLPGVTVIVKGTQMGTITAVDGGFTLHRVFGDETLVFSFVGMKSREIFVDNRTVINLAMEEDRIGIAEIVAVGYGKQKRVASTVAVSSIKSDEVARKPVTNLSNTFAGRMSGTFAKQGSGHPGADGAEISIRGLATTGSAAPLCLVDGVPRNIYDLDPNMITDITILKDAAAVAPYGMSGANGVILVNTKKGKAGAPVLSYSVTVGFQNPTRMNKLVNSYEYALIRNEAFENEGRGPYAAFSQQEVENYRKAVENGVTDDRYPNSDGLNDIILNNRLMTNHNVQMSGGNELFKYFASVGYSSQQGMWSTTDMKKYSALINLDIHAAKYTDIGISVNTLIKETNNPAFEDFLIIGSAYRALPISSVYFTNGLWGQSNSNSVVGNVYHSGYSKNENNWWMTSISVDQEIPFVKGLSVKGVFNYDPSHRHGKTWKTPIPFYTLNPSTIPYSYTKGIFGSSKPSLSVDSSQSKSYTSQGIISYERSLGMHHVSALGVVEVRIVKGWEMGASRANYDIALEEINAGSTSGADWGNSGSSSEARQIGYVYRVGYHYDNKYLVEVSGRYDGHYYFAPGKRFGFFPAFSLGWNLAEESFMKNRWDWLNRFKLRASYGESGNLAGDPFQYLSNFGFGTGANWGGTPSLAVYEFIQGNPNITWERAKKYNVGFESSILDNLFTLEADFFHERRSNMLVTPDETVPYEYGLDLSEINAGVMQNRGFELMLTFKKSIRKDLFVSALATFSYSKNKLIEVFETEVTSNNPNRRLTGRPLGTEFGLKSTGFFQESDFNTDGTLKEGLATLPYEMHPGDIRYADINGYGTDGKVTGKPDGKIDDADITVTGYSQRMPGIIWGFCPTISWKGFDLNALFQGAGRFSLNINGSLAEPFFESGSVTKLYFDDHWTPENTNARYPRASAVRSPNNYTWRSSFWMKDATYVRLKNLELGYTILTRFAQRAGMESIRVFTSGQNLWTWTPHIKEKIDPEAGDDWGYYYYQQAVIAFGLNVTF